MNPLVIISAALDVIIESAKRKNQKEAKRDHIHFICSYVVLMAMGASILVWTVWELYFKK